MTTLVQLLDRAVQNHLWQDAPVGAVLSGGIDSSTVVKIAQRWQPDLHTFTGWYDEPGYDERRYARMAAGPNHLEIQITPWDFVRNFDDMIAAFRPPFQGMGMFGQYMVAKHIASETDVKIVLSGEGSDELFGGYARLMKVAEVAGFTVPDGYSDYKIPDGYPRSVPEALQYDLDRLPDLLAVDDQALGAFGLEGRAPFTDPSVVDYALALPPWERVAKIHLKAALRGIVPDPILNRTDKMGMPCPLVKWMRDHTHVRDFVADRLGYVPDLDQPFARGWWVELCEKASGLDQAAA